MSVYVLRKNITSSMTNARLRLRICYYYYFRLPVDFLTICFLYVFISFISRLPICTLVLAILIFLIYDIDN